MGLPNISWLKHVGQIIGKILHVVAKDGPPALEKAAVLAQILLPQFAFEIEAADSLATRILKQVVVTEAVTTGVGTATAGADKLAHAIAGIGPEIDQWIANLFPGAQKVSDLRKAGLVSAIADIVNEQPLAPVVPSPGQ